jgi:hypothetical protein
MFERKRKSMAPGNDEKASAAALRQFREACRNLTDISSPQMKMSIAAFFLMIYFVVFIFFGIAIRAIYFTGSALASYVILGCSFALAAFYASATCKRVFKAVERWKAKRG